MTECRFLGKLTLYFLQRTTANIAFTFTVKVKVYSLKTLKMIVCLHEKNVQAYLRSTVWFA